MTTEELFLTLHWRGWSFESNGQGAMFIWKNANPMQQLVIDARNDIIVNADLTADVIDALTLLRSWKLNIAAEATA